MDWIRSPCKPSKGSILWRDVVEYFPLTGDTISWKIGNGKNVQVGVNPWVGADNAFRMADPIIRLLNLNVHSISDAVASFP